MKCPHCEEELRIPPRAFRNVEDCRSRVKVTTECCGEMITLSGEVTFTATKDSTGRKEDDWGIPIKEKSEYDKARAAARKFANAVCPLYSTTGDQWEAVRSGFMAGSKWKEEKNN